MGNLFKVIIKPVPLAVQDAVKAVILRMLGPNAVGQAEQLLQSGGTVSKDLNEQAANHVVSLLQNAGAEAELVEISDSAPALFRIRLVSFGTAKIQVIKQVRNLTGLGLRESKELVESLGIILDNIDEPLAIKAKVALEGAGATTRIEEIAGTDDQEPLPDSGTMYQVTGKVTLFGEHVDGVLVRAYDKDLRSEQFLGESSTASAGKYEIYYSSEQFKRSDKNSADLLLRVFNEVGIELALKTEVKEEQDIFFNSPKKAEIDLQLQESTPVKASEYERLEALIFPALDGATLVDLSLQDINFLINETEINEFPDEFPAKADSIHFIAQSAKFAREINIAAEAFYGWARLGAGIISVNKQDTLDLNALLEKNNKQLRNTLEQAIEGIIVPPWLIDQIDSTLRQLQNLRDEREQEERNSWIQHQVKGILVDANSTEPLDGYFVRAGVSGQNEAPNLERSITNTQGEFVVTYALPPESVISTQQLLLHIEAPNGEVFDKQEITVVVDQSDPVTVKINVPVPLEPGENIPLELLPMTFSSELNTVLETNGLNTIADLRKLGGLEKLNNLPDTVRASDELKTLQAHVDLSLLGTDLEPEKQIEQNQFLIVKGFNSYFDITAMPVERFTDVISADASNIIQPESLYYDALRLGYFLDNAHLNRVIGGNQAEAPELQSNPTLSCQCEDCVSALSPGAYLTDLIGYVTKQVVREDINKPITLDFLVEKFHQPLSKLPINCAATKTQVRQVRIACEVLYQSLSDTQLTDSINKTKSYREKAYAALLNAIGTSPAYLQRASSEEELESIANRIGISTDQVEQLQQQDTALTEQTLEELFGLPAFIEEANAKRLNPLRFLKKEQPLPLLYNWRMEHVKEQWKQQEFPENALFGKTIPIIDPDIIGPDDFRNTVSANRPAFSIWVARREWVDLQVSRFYNTLSSDQNSQKDNLATALKEMSVQISYTPAGAQEAKFIPWAEQTTIDDLIAQQELLVTHGKEDKFKQWLEARHLSADALAELSKYASDVEAGKEFNDEEWQAYVSNTVNILVEAAKKAAYESWLKEESNNRIVLDLNIFWPSLTEPKEGQWPALMEQNRPLIDPERVEKVDLPDGKFGEEARTLWQQRFDQIKAKQKEYANDLKTKDALRINKILTDVYGGAPTAALGDTWIEAIEQLDTDRKDFDVLEADKAKKIMSDDLLLSEPEFQSLVSASLLLKDPEKQLSDTLLNELIIILASAHKQKVLYTTTTTATGWIDEDKGLAYWKALKARLPKWRAGGRQTWQQALEYVNKAPLIEPDIISGEVLLEPVIGNFSFDTWRSRTKLIDAELQTISAFIESNNNVSADVVKPEAANKMLNAYLGISMEELLELDKQEAAGISIITRLLQLALARDAYLLLLEVAKRVTDDKKVLKTTRENIYAILLQIWKRKQFAQWRTEEKEKLSLSPEFFKSPKRRITSIPQGSQKWRVDRRNQRAWHRTLKGRIEQQETLASSLKNIVSDVEEQALPALRDTLVNIIDTSTNELPVKAEKLTKQFLVGMQISGCQMTTRMSMALELLQMLIFSVRSGELKIAGIKLSLESKIFEKEWKWMGSYATWKAAMGVFLYPEQILYPSLREEQTSEFRRLTSQVSNNFTPEQACKIGDEYYEYLKDVSSLEVKATCWGKAYKKQRKCLDEGLVGSDRELFYMFAISEDTKTCYWSAYDLEAQTGAAIGFIFGADIRDTLFQSSWQALPIGVASVTDIVGATPFKDKIYVVLRIIVKEEEKLGSILYDLKRGTWGELTKLDIPDNTGVKSVTLVQQDYKNNEEQLPTIICQVSVKYKEFRYKEYDAPNIGKYEPQDIYFSLPSISYQSIIYLNVLSDAGDSWGDGWKILRYEETIPYNSEIINSAVQYRGGLFIILGDVYIFFSKRSLSISFQFLNSVSDLDRHLELEAKAKEIRSGIQLLDTVIKQLVTATWLKVDTLIDIEGSVLNRISLIKELSDIGDKKREIIPFGDWGIWRNRNTGGFNNNDGVMGSRLIYKNGHPVIVLFTTPNHYTILYLPSSNIDLDNFSYRKEAPLTSSTGELEYQGEANRASSIAVHNGGFQSKIFNKEPYLYVHNHAVGNNYSPTFVYSKLFQIMTKLDGDVYSLASNTLRSLSVKFRSPTGSNQLKRENPISLSSTTVRKKQIRAEWIEYNSKLQDSLLAVLHLDEAYHAIPQWIAIQLARSGYYNEALDWFRLVYDYTLSSNRKISWMLRREEHDELEYTRKDTWPDKLNPHSFARGRKNAYSRFTIQSIIRCLLDYADSEFTFDTTESVARAKKLYETALELIQSELPPPPANKCQALINGITFDVKDITLQPYYDYLKVRLGELTRTDLLKQSLEEVKKALNSNQSEEARLSVALQKIGEGLGEKKPSFNILDILARSRLKKIEMGRQLLAGINIGTLLPISLNRGLNLDSSTGNTTEIEDIEIDDFSKMDYTPNLSYEFCIPNNPTSRFLLLRTELNLFKIRNCMNIAGMQRELEPYAAPIDVESALPSMGAGGQINLAGITRIRPTLYRYPVLVDRAKQLASLAQQTEASFFSATQSKGQEAYTVFKARQDVELSKEGVKLQKLRVRESENGVDLAELQLERTAILEKTYAEWSNEDKLKLETLLIEAYKAASDLQRTTSALRYGSQAAQITASMAESAPWVVAFRAAALASTVAEGIVDQLGITKQLSIQTLSLEISIELRKREYELQLQLATQDQEIGNQQIKLANDRVRITEQEQSIAEIQSEQASDTVIFLQEKFTNVELYDWMSGVLENIFRYYLQQASSMSKLAEIQLAFERQEPLMGVIKNDYYELPNNDGNDSAGSDSSGTDRRGLTGSARLLRDITKLDQYAFNTDQRKQQLSVNFSLSQLDPFAFQQFKKTGVLNFDTPGKLFDRRFPGQYLRLIKRVRVSVVALVSPVQGISATLTASGISRVVIAGDIFQTTVIRRNPESIAFTNPIGASGVFELNPNPEMLLPFEGNGVDTRWEFRLPKASNPMDYSSIADVLITIEYTALHNRTYQEQVQRELDTYTSFDRGFSFRQAFSDAWYDLHNPDMTDSPMLVSFATTLADFPANIQHLSISHILMYFVTDADLPTVFEATLTFNSTGSSRGGTAAPIDGVISTRSNGTNWASIKGEPEGTWQLQLPNTPIIRKLFLDEKIDDILLVLTCEGELPNY